MILARVRGEVVATIKHEAYVGKRLKLLRRVGADGLETGAYLVAVDAVDSVADQTVLVIDEGNSARQIVGDATAPIRSVIIGIVDQVDVPPVGHPK